MKNEELIIRKLRGLPGDKQQQVLDFIQFLENQSRSTDRATLKFEWTGMSLKVGDEDVKLARREMWRAFPAAEV